MSTKHPNYQKVMAALRANPEPLIEWAAVNLVVLGARSEWDMDDNFLTTEGLAGLAGDYGLPSASDQDKEALRFYGDAAVALGYDADSVSWEDDKDEDEED